VSLKQATPGYFLCDPFIVVQRERYFKKWPFTTERDHISSRGPDGPNELKVAHLVACTLVKTSLFYPRLA
jgi:hypothetical protein